MDWKLEKFCVALGEGIEFRDGGEDGKAIGVHGIGGDLVDAFGGD